MSNGQSISGLLTSLERVTTRDPAEDEKAELLDCVFAYRLLLGRNPSIEQEIPYLAHFSERGTLREFLTKIRHSDEFKNQVGFLPAGHMLMAELPDFRFWFNTTDTEMGTRMGLGIYEPETLKFFRDTVRPGMTCWDVGAQTGFFTCLFSVLAGEAGHVIAYEPMPRSFAIIQKNVAENGFGNRVLARNVACSDAAGFIPMVEGAGMLIVDHDAKDAQGISCVRLDQEDHSRLPDLIKIDVEGHEPAVLRGLEGVLDRCSPILVLELNEHWLKRHSNTTGGEIIQYLNNLGFDVFPMEGSEQAIDWESFRQAPSDNFNVVARRTLSTP